MSDAHGKSSQNQRSISLIGMPGSGKSTVGRMLAERLNFEFVDVDRLIESGEGLKLHQLIDRDGMQGFLDLEADYIQSVTGQTKIISPGGSVIYRDRACEHLRSLGPVVYLWLPLDELTRRLGDLQARGVAIAPGKTLGDLYNERCPKYEQWATATVDCRQLPARQAAERVAAVLAMSRDIREAPGKC